MSDMSDALLGEDRREPINFRDPDYWARTSGTRRTASPSSIVTSRLSERSRSTLGNPLMAGFNAFLGRQPPPPLGAQITSGAASVGQGIGAGLRGVGGAGQLLGEAFDSSRGHYGGAMGETQYPGWRGYRDAGMGRGALGDAETILRSMTPEQRVRLQERLVGAGFIAGGTLSWGNPADEKTLDGFRSLLAYANSEGQIWQATLQGVEKLIEETGVEAGGDGGRAPFVAPTYVAPDYATLAQSVKEQMRQSLGRDPDESEMAMLTAELAGWDRDAFDTEVAAARSEYDAGEEGRDAPAQMQGVDPVARFKESFESRFAGELRGIERTEDAAETQEIVQAGVSRLSQMSGGMG